MVLFFVCGFRDAAPLLIHPNRAQFFEYESITFYCEGVSYCEVVREFKGKTLSCSFSNKRTSTGSSCTIKNVYSADSGEYWFEDGGGNKSNSVNITVTAGSVILEIPALPVMEGEAVTLTCRNKTTSSQTSADFYKDGVLINTSSTGNMIMNSVSKSDKELYKCSIFGAGESAESWLTVRSETQQHLKIELIDDQKERVTPSANETVIPSGNETVAPCCKKTVTSTSSSTPWIIVTVLLLVPLVVVGILHFVRCYRHRDDQKERVTPSANETVIPSGNETVAPCCKKTVTSTSSSTPWIIVTVLLLVPLVVVGNFVRVTPE
ncbi:uncharacterized protein LOC117153116 [Anabas testudineus]|uniref:uncharacterized protein LOC117153116 n=1 Tax=Anabas testudineus TaxID=64144 RepID=UPI00143DF269|nr:uncharacterized protein LOC117153116 [Anabas testudineus]